MLLQMYVVVILFDAFFLILIVHKESMLIFPSDFAVLFLNN
jgi:hypothetical protein